MASLSTIKICFNSRSREGSDADTGGGGYENSVSIHAPARGATGRGSSKISRYQGFNSRSREGSDGEVKHRLPLTSVSIHAPARGATGRCVLVCGAFKVSIHAPARGATQLSISIPTYSKSFNSRSREGSDSVGKNITN